MSGEATNYDIVSDAFRREQGNPHPGLGVQVSHVHDLLNRLRLDPAAVPGEDTEPHPVDRVTVVTNDADDIAEVLARLGFHPATGQGEEKPEPPLDVPASDDPDALHWAEAFVGHVRHHSGIATDVGTMTGWFANAMMAKSDHERNQGVVRDFLGHGGERLPDPEREPGAPVVDARGEPFIRSASGGFWAGRQGNLHGNDYPTRPLTRLVPETDTGALSRAVGYATSFRVPIPGAEDEMAAVVVERHHPPGRWKIAAKWLPDALQGARDRAPDTFSDVLDAVTYAERVAAHVAGVLRDYRQAVAPAQNDGLYPPR